jgi:hypothetical protein
LISDCLEIAWEFTDVALGGAATAKDDIDIAEVGGDGFCPVVVLDDLDSELERGLRGCLEDLRVLSTVLLAHDAWKEETHVDLFGYIEEETGTVISGELGTDFLESQVVLTTGLQIEFVEKEGLMELEMTLEGSKGIWKLFKELVSCKVV